MNLFYNSDAVEFFVEEDTQTSEQVHRVRFSKPLPDALPGIIADAVNNLRSSLDQAVFAIAGVVSANAGQNYSFFPFSNTDTEFENRLKGACKGFPQKIIDIIAESKAYRGGYNHLWSLNKVWNTAKHEIICSVGVSSNVPVNKFTIKGTLPSGTVLPAFVWDKEKIEMEIVRYPIGSPIDIQINFNYYIVMSGIEFVDGVPLDDIIGTYIRIVERIVGELEAELIKLGL